MGQEFRSSLSRWFQIRIRLQSSEGLTGARFAPQMTHSCQANWHWLLTGEVNFSPCELSIGLFTCPMTMTWQLVFTRESDSKNKAKTTEVFSFFFFPWSCLLSHVPSFLYHGFCWFFFGGGCVPRNMLYLSCLTREWTCTHCNGRVES